MARHHQVWLLTRANNRPMIEQALRREPLPELSFVYYDLPAWARWWKKGPRGVQLYYYLWQLALLSHARRLHRQIGFDLAWHLTFGKYWSPSRLPALGVPFVWGPVGGAEDAPLSFWPGFGIRGCVLDGGRCAARSVAEFDPLLACTARGCRLGLTKTEESALRLKALGVEEVRVWGEVAFSGEELERLGELPLPHGKPIRFLTLARLVHWKGVHLALAAFAEAALPEAEYWIVGDGAERARLETLARKLGVAERVRFWGQKPRPAALELLGQSHVLVHLSLHDSGGWVCPEAMAARRPVICLALGGPGTQVDQRSGIALPAHNPQQVIRDAAQAMRRFAEDDLLLRNTGESARNVVLSEYLLERRVRQLAEAFTVLVSKQPKSGY